MGTRRPCHRKGLGLPEGDRIGKLYFKSRTVIVAGTINDKLAQRTVSHLLALAEVARVPVRFTSFEAFPLTLPDLARAHAAFPALEPLAALHRKVDQALADDAVKGVVITSGKPDFAAGMDLNVIGAMKDAGGAQAVFYEGAEHAW